MMAPRFLIFALIPRKDQNKKEHDFLRLSVRRHEKIPRHTLNPRAKHKALSPEFIDADQQARILHDSLGNGKVAQD
jgi:hypothetical protein